MSTYQQPDAHGHFGPYGGSFVSETLTHAINELRDALAAKHRTDFACPITTGIFAWIAAHAAAEAEAAGRKRITPFWRTLKVGGELNAKYPGGLANLRARLEAEGHQVRSRGKRSFVVEFEQKLFKRLA